jgi:hypothetical protein
MNTISDNDLILYFYRDGLDPARQAAIEHALQASAPLRERYATLQRLLDGVDAAPVEADPDFTRRIWQRLEERIGATAAPRAATRWLDRLLAGLHPLLSPRLAIVATCVLALAVGIGYFAGRRDGDNAMAARNGEVAARDGAMAERVLDAYVARHLRATEGLLLTAANSDSAELHAGNSDLAATLVESNRLYAAAAARAGNARLADFLRQLEPVLIDLANRPADASVQSREGLRDYLRKTDLLFQVRATEARIDNTGRHRT